MPFTEEQLQKLQGFSAVRSGEIGRSSLGTEDYPITESPFWGSYSTELERKRISGMKATRDAEKIIKRFGGEVPPADQDSPGWLGRIFGVLNYPGSMIREHIFGQEEGSFVPAMQKIFGVEDPNAPIDIPLPYTPPVKKTAGLNLPGMVTPKTPGSEAVFGTSPDPGETGKRLAAWGIGTGLDIATDPLSWVGLGTETSTGRSLLAFMPKGPFTGLGEAKTLIKGEKIGEVLEKGVETFGKIPVPGTGTTVGRVLGKAFIPKYGLPAGYHELGDEMKKDLLHITMEMDKHIENMFMGMNPSEINYAAFAVEFPDMLNSVSITPIISAAKTPRTKQIIQQAIDPTEVNIGKINKAVTEFQRIQESYSSTLVNYGLLDKDSLIENYLPHILEADPSIGFRGTQLPRLRGYGGKLEDKKEFFQKPRTHQTLVDDMDAGYTPKFGLDLVTRNLSRSVEIVLAKKQFLEKVLDEFGTKVNREELDKHTVLLEQGQKLYMPTGSLRFYPNWTVSEHTIVKKANPKQHLVELDYDDFKRGVGLTSNVPAYLMPKEIAADLNKVVKVFGDEESSNAFLHFWDKTMTYWKGNVTVTTPGFHLRNEQGNIFNSWLAGLNNPVRFEQAWKVANGTNFKLGQWNEKELMSMAEHLGVYKPEGAFMGDITRVNPQKLGPAKISQLINPFSSRFGPVEVGRVGGSAIENNARLALFLDRLAKGDPPIRASDVVKKYLFDYGDLTDIEKSVFRRVIPFYTWLRKNTALQAEHLFTTPGKYSMVSEVLNATPEEQEKMLPYEQRPAFDRTQGTSVATPFRVGGLPTMLNLDLPTQELEFGTLTDIQSTGTLRNVAPQIQSIMQFTSGISSKKAHVAMPEIPAMLARALPEDLRKKVGIGDIKSMLTGQPIPGMDPRAKAFLLNTLPLVGKIGRLLPTQENLASPRYIRSVTSTLLGAGIEPVDVKGERARAVISHRRQVEETIMNMLKEGQMDSRQYNFLRRILKSH